MSQHVPVLVDEILHAFELCGGQSVVDGTLGGGGHTRLLAERILPGGSVIALDRDPEAVRASQQWVDETQLPVQLCVSNFADLPEVLQAVDHQQVDAILLDLGLSSDQLADTERGFSFDAEGPLDLRFDPLEGEPAYRLLDRLGERHLADLIYQFGEERYSRRIARRIVQQRHTRPIRTSRELAQLICGAIPKNASRQRIHPATRTFQALRIAINEEMKALETALHRLPDCLVSGGKLAIISFHSLEDRLVKRAFRDDSRLESLAKKPIRPSPEEVAANPRSRSARLRVAKRT
ncbi:MAG: 16S rRNA (cytosine(1402)-N(4))-methyltransferase [Planctomycetaceae bacterium]|nr:16S rRNA (cytosine(1402)-N(4))-methyltransferase [Planctomycetaceae bacterium]